MVKGLVQGVGFRPFIYRIAIRNNLTGWVDNRTDGVYIKIQGKKSDIDNFIIAIKKEAPPASQIKSIDIKNDVIDDLTEFTIVKSKNTSEGITDVSPDICVCDDCLEDMLIQKNRLNYPFINCTNCGPRFTIIKDLPYDRDNTTMESFKMCDECNNEYKNISDRRFHAQPTACIICGPEYKLILKNESIEDLEKIIDTVAKLIDDGKIVAIKGIGGFFIACDATNEYAVSTLRNKKIREGKPFAVMFSDISELKKYAFVNPEEEKEIISWRKPIILLKNKKDIARSVCEGFNTIGAMLPYMPLHFLLFKKLCTKVIVLTSGNFSDEPIIIDNEKAISELSKIVDAVLIYNRDIYNRSDDSVAFIANKKTHIIRRSRGFVPSPINLNFNVNNIIATGAELVNCFCIGKGNQAILSQHIGDLKNIETYDFFIESIERFKKLFRLSPEYYACDLHPDYLSSKYADESGLPVIKIQHHYAHIASCMAENQINEKIIGIAFDGTGYGTDGNIWGGEFLICDFNEFERYKHFDYIPIPGGDIATKETWRSGFSYLYKTFGKDIMNMNIPFIQQLDKNSTEIIIQAIDKKINSPLSSSSGRLFDAVAAITNICPNSLFHAEAPMRLETIIDQSVTTNYPYEKKENSISFIPTIDAITTDILNNTKNEIISARFHNTIISVICLVASEIRDIYNINKIVLSGGSFQNRYILENSVNLLQKNEFEVFTNQTVPCNDGGIALGQLVIAANKINN